MFGRKKHAAETCPNGHPQDPSWEQCPFCVAESADQPAETIGRPSPDGERLADPGDGAVVVPRKIAPPRALAGWLVVMNGEDADRDHRLHGGPNVLGKGADCDVIVRDAQASQRHAVIRSRDGVYTVEDLDSKYGTLLNGEPLAGTRTLPDGALLRIGGTELKFRSFSA
jgi:hypothetical protein